MKRTMSVGGAKRWVLYIENHKDSREMLAIWLEIAGYNVVATGDVAEGMQLAERQPFDLIILESKYPDVRGTDLCRRIRAFAPKLPIIFFSSSVYPADIKDGLSAGAQYYLRKPDDIISIVQIITGLVTERAAGER